MLASALWGMSYPLIYLALRLFSINNLIALSYLFSVALLLIILPFYGYDGESIIKGLLLSPINYVIIYLYTELSGGAGGLTALVSSSYIVPLIALDYVTNRSINTRYIISAITLLGALYLLFQGYGDSIYGALLLMVMNLIYTISLVRIGDVDIINFVLGQSLGTLMISYLVMRSLSASTLALNYLYYPLILALVGNVIPYALYAESIKRIGPVETSLTSSIETVSSLVASLPIQQLPSNPVAWILLAISILSLNIELRKGGLGYRWGLMDYHGFIRIGKEFVASNNEARNYVISINLRSVFVIGRRKII
ncbi:hypothetical protein GCM10007112_13660 [Vulcanisaeta souniana JCM 11219]|nr:hypothetical protein GCM10007112_13660 [Vulcanisaeta souniana JCM 11219]